MKCIALKIDVDTCRGALVGVPALVDVLQRHAAGATFFCALGPDRSGRQTRAESLVAHYGVGTRLRGVLLPALEIGRRAADTLRHAREAGFELAIHGWDRARWENLVPAAENAWVETEMTRAGKRFTELFGEPAFAHGAAGWRNNRHALRLTQRLGFCYASDCRGQFPFIPVVDGEIVCCPQLPTTLPTLDERLAQRATSPEEAGEQLLAASDSVAGDHVFTLRAELEGMKYLDVFEHLIVGWLARGYRLIALRDLLGTRNVAQMPRHNVVFGTLPGRAGLRMLQGSPFLQDGVSAFGEGE